MNLNRQEECWHLELTSIQTNCSCESSVSLLGSAFFAPQEVYAWPKLGTKLALADVYIIPVVQTRTANTNHPWGAAIGSDDQRIALLCDGCGDDAQSSAAKTLVRGN